MLIRLHDPSFLPKHLIKWLAALRPLLEQREYIENLIQDEPRLTNIAKELAAFLQEHEIVGYHCTKEPEPGHFLRHGLRKLDNKSHRSEFLARYSDKFSPAGLADLKEAWALEFTRNRDRHCNGQLWFCFSPQLVSDGGTELFFRYMGGEAIYHCLPRESEALHTLEQLGVSVVVETAIRVSDIVHSAYPLEHGALSHYHQTINPNAFLQESAGYVTNGIPPERILRVIPRDDFLKAVGLRDDATTEQ